MTLREQQHGGGRVEKRNPIWAALQAVEREAYVRDREEGKRDSGG